MNAAFTDRVPALRGDYISRAPYKGATPFWLAAQQAYVPMMRLLVEAGADPTRRNAFGTTPLMVASGLGENDARRPPDHRVEEAVRLLLSLGADVAAVDLGGRTALHGAAGMWEDGVIQLLVDYGADVNVEDGRGRTPLYTRPSTATRTRPRRAPATLLRRLGATEPVVEQ